MELEYKYKYELSLLTYEKRNGDRFQLFLINQYYIDYELDTNYYLRVEKPSLCRVHTHSISLDGKYLYRCYDDKKINEETLMLTYNEDKIKNLIEMYRLVI